MPDVQIRIHIDPPVPAHLHLHLDVTPPDARLDQLIQLLEEINLSDLPAAIQGLTTAISSMSARIDEDVAHLRDLLAQALAASAEDEATAARLQAEADAAFASITDATSTLTSIDPVSDFPAVEPPPEP